VRAGKRQSTIRCIGNAQDEDRSASDAVVQHTYQRGTQKREKRKKENAANKSVIVVGETPKFVTLRINLAN